MDEIWFRWLPSIWELIDFRFLSQSSISQYEGGKLRFKVAYSRLKVAYACLSGVSESEGSILQFGMAYSIVKVVHTTLGRESLNGL